MRQALLFVLSFALIACACCSSGSESPIEPGGEIPELLASLPDGEYLAVGFLDIGEVLDSEVGRYALARFAVFDLMLQGAGVSLRDFHELAFAVAFESRAHPNLLRSLPLIVVLRADVDLGAVERWLPLAGRETFELEGSVVHRYRVRLPTGGRPLEGAAFVSVPSSGSVVLSTSLELLEDYFAVRAGRRAGIGAGGAIGDLLATADKRVPGWAALRHSEESRSLLDWLAPFEHCIISLAAGEELRVLCVMSFEQERDAEGAVESFEIGRREMGRYLPRERSVGAELAGAAVVEFLLELEGSQRGRLAIFRGEYSREWLAGLFAPSRSGTAAEEDPGEEQ